MKAPSVYLDYNATTPLHPALIPYVTENLSRWGNPSSVHWAGREAKKLISMARDNVSQYFNVNPLEIIFTSSGSEANNQGIKNSLPLGAGPRNEILFSAVEHPSVIKTVEAMESRGYKAISIPVNRLGEIDLEFLQKRLSEKTALVTVQLVNNETGNIFPVKKIAEMAHAAGAVMHSDMVQALGKIPVDLQDLNVDLASFAGHKFYSLKGAAVLFVRRGIHVDSLVSGGGQERGRRAGTENALAIGCLGQAFAILSSEIQDTTTKITALRDKLENDLLKKYPQFRFNGIAAPRVGNTINITCPGIDGETLLINLDTRGVAISSGAACSSGSQEPSPVLRAMGLTIDEASQSMRISLGYFTTAEEIEFFKTQFDISIAHMMKSQNAEAFGI